MGLGPTKSKNRRYPDGKTTKNNTKKRRNGKGFNKNGAKARKINASTVYETCTAQLSPFGGLLALIKFLDLVRFKEIVDSLGHNTKYRGKKALRPILCFIDESREYLIGKLRKGQTVSGKEAADFIKKINDHLPGCVREVLLRADGEFLSWKSVAACIEAGFDFIIANKGCQPPFDPNAWYRPWKRKNIQYNSCVYQPGGWGVACRFMPTFKLSCWPITSGVI